MKTTFFTEIDTTVTQKDINYLYLRMNFDSPRTQTIMKRIDVTREECEMKNTLDFHSCPDPKRAYQQHLRKLQEILTLIVEQRKIEIGGNPVTLPKMINSTQKVNFIKKIYDHDLAQLYKSELGIKRQQAKNSHDIKARIEQKFKSITEQAQKHNQLVVRKLSQVRQREKYTLEERLTKSMDFGNKFTGVDEKMNLTRQQFVSEITKKNKLDMEVHKRKKHLLIQLEEQQRKDLQERQNYNRSQILRSYKASPDKIQLSKQIEEQNQLEYIQKVGSLTSKGSELYSKSMRSIQESIKKQKEREELKLTRTLKQKESLTQFQFKREQIILEDLTKKLSKSQDAVQKKLQSLKIKMKTEYQSRQTKQQVLLDKFIKHQERKNLKILHKHIQIRSNLKQQEIPEDPLYMQYKDQKFKGIEDAQRRIVSKSSDTILKLLNKLNK